MSKLIKLHTFKGIEILINTDNITFVIAKNDDAEEANATVCFGIAVSVDTRETLKEIEEILSH